MMQCLSVSAWLELHFSAFLVQATLQFTKNRLCLCSIAIIQCCWACFQFQFKDDDMHKALSHLLFLFTYFHLRSFCCFSTCTRTMHFSFFRRVVQQQWRLFLYNQPLLHPTVEESEIMYALHVITHIFYVYIYTYM